MMIAKFDKYKITISCFLAETFANIVETLFIVCIYKFIDFTNYKVYKTAVLGCVPEVWMTGTVFISFIVYRIFWFLISFYLAKKGEKENNINFIIGGAFGFYPLIHLVFFQSINYLSSSPFWFLEKKEVFLNKFMPLFGNLYVFKQVDIFVQITFLIISLVWTLHIVTKIWSKNVRNLYFTYGLISAILGRIFWFFIVGNLFVKLF